MDILLVLLNYLLPVIASIIAMFMVAGAKKLLEKWGIEKSEKIDNMLDTYVKKGVGVAQVAATKWLSSTGVKMNGSSKKAKAVDVVMKELKQSGITNVAEELISNRIEAWLLSDGQEPGIPSPE